MFIFFISVVYSPLLTQIYKSIVRYKKEITMVLDPAVHAALIVIAIWLVNLVLTSLHINLGGDTVTELATLIVGYILSLFGYAAYKALVNKVPGLNNIAYTYHPPFG